jgi:ParB family transcriptional regulator, chromosome partitioning protein
VARRSGLGRGLDALIPSGVTQPSASALRDVLLTSIRPNQYQPRKHFDEESLSTLVDSIRAIGVLQPVLLRETGSGEYELIAGERRWRASRRAGLQTIPALVQVADDVSSLEQALVENLHREDLNALDEAAAYQQLIEEFHLTHEDVARRVGKSRAAITNSLRLFQLPTVVQRLVRDSKLSPGHARALLATPDRELQERLAQEAVVENLSVRALEELVRAYIHGESLGALAEATAASMPTQPDVEPAGELEQSSPPLTDEERAAPSAGDPAVPRPGQSANHVSGHRGAGHSPGVREHGGLRPPGVLELEELLATHLDTRVRVDMGARRGRIVVDFATIEDLERIYRAMLGDTGR